MIFNNKLLKNVLERTEKEGVRKAAALLFEDLGIISVTASGTIPPKGPLLVISNHTGVFDSLLLLSLIQREDFHEIALSTFGIFGPKVKEKILPMYRKSRLHHKIYEYPLCLQVLGYIPDKLPIDEIRARNRQSIRKAAGLINIGKSVSIFPTGSAGKNLNGSSWKPGVGFLIRQITRPETKVVFVKIKGTKMSDIVAFTHPFLSRLLFRPRPIKILFGKEQYLRDLVNGESDAKKITLNLEKRYLDYWN